MIATVWDDIPQTCPPEELKQEADLPLQHKLHIERLELSTKIEKLKTFMTMSPDFKSVNYFHKRLLDNQLSTMQNYENILVQRMTDLNNPDKNEN
jgi:hypothetical protein